MSADHLTAAIWAEWNRPEHDAGCPGDEKYCVLHCPVPAHANMSLDGLADAAALACSQERAEGLAVAEYLLRRVADYWDGRPTTHHGDHIYADLLDVLKAITPVDTAPLTPATRAEEATE